MNNKEVAKLIPVIQAFLEGKTIERKTRNWEFNKGWCDATQWEETEELKRTEAPSTLQRIKTS